MVERINQRTNPLLGNNICRLRIRENKRPVDVLSELSVYGIEVRAGAYYKIENGENNPTVEMLIALTKILNCSFNDFFENKTDS